MTPAEHQVETKIANLGLTAPRITAQEIDALMKDVTYHHHLIPGTTTILATAIMPSGFTLATGESACASPENFNLKLGIEIAIGKAERLARDELWKLEGYRLKQTMHEIHQTLGRNAIKQARDSLGGSAASKPGPPSPCCVGASCTGACGSSPAPTPGTGA